MPTTVVTGKAASYPQTGDNRTRADIVKDILDYVGGESSTTMAERAGRALNAAIRYFNSVAWSFNRITDDILLDPNVGMLNNSSAPSLSRDAGGGTGFVLTTGTPITYWVEERVKVGSRIVKRNFEDGTKTVTLVGDGTTDKPVLTRPAIKNPDSTHWALYGTDAGGAYPSGAEILEVPIATTTIEDTRLGNNPGLPSGAIYRASDFDLSGDFRNPVRCNLLDPEGRECKSLIYMPWRVYSMDLVRTSTTSTPTYYTIYNAYRQGKVQFYPRVGQGPQSYPYARVTYNARIAQLHGDTDKLLVPEEVEEALMQVAIIRMQNKYRSVQESVIGLSEVRDLRDAVAAEYQDFEDF